MPPQVTHIAALGERLVAPSNVDLVFIKIWAENDDTGRHGVVIPIEAYPLFGNWQELLDLPGQNHTRTLTVETRVNGRATSGRINLKYYQRYPERRLTSLARGASFRSIHRAHILARRVDAPGLVEIHPLDLADQADRNLLQAAGLVDLRPGTWAVFRSDADLSRPEDPGVAEIVAAFDALAGRPVWLSSSTDSPPPPKAVGLTAQEIVGKLGEDNVAGPDIHGTELKGQLAADWRSERMPGQADLGLREPAWVDRRSTRARVLDWGRADRTSDYISLNVNVNARYENDFGFQLAIDRPAKRLMLLRLGGVVGWWDFVVLHGLLNEKLRTTVYVLADKAVAGVKHGFAYHTIILATSPSVSAMLELIDEGDVWIEVRMRIRGGVPKNRGTQFRVRLRSLARLFGRVQVLRQYPR